MKKILLSIIIILTSIGVVHAGGITVSNFDGGWDNDTKVTTERPVTWSIHWNTIPYGVGSFTNGFKVYISDQSDGSIILNPGPGFAPITIETIYSFYCPTYMEQQINVDGIGADTIGFGGLDCCGFKSICDLIDEDVWTITTQVENSAEGYYLCLDSSYFPPGGAWLWSPNDGSASFNPSWDGPHCYLIENGCVTRGDANHDGNVLVDDLILLKDYIFNGGPAPVSPYEGDVNANGNILVNDLVFLVSYLFKGGDTPPLCD